MENEKLIYYGMYALVFSIVFSFVFLSDLDHWEEFFTDYLAFVIAPEEYSQMKFWNRVSNDKCKGDISEMNDEQFSDCMNALDKWNDSINALPRGR